MGEFFDLNTDTVVNMIAKGLDEKRKRQRTYDPVYHQAYYQINKNRINDRKRELNKYYADMEVAYDKIVAENSRLRERNRLLEAIVKGIKKNE